MNVIEIVEKYLEDNGYDGLYDTVWGPCGCKKDDLAPCEGLLATCEPGYKGPCDCGEGCDFHIGPEKPPKAGEE